MLAQEERLSYFTSRTLKIAARYYATVELECLSVQLFLKKYRPYFRKLPVNTDHNVLLKLPNKKRISVRIIRGP